MCEGVRVRVWDGDRASFDRNLAVVISINHYSNASIRDLSTAVSDARAIANLLEQKYDYKQSDDKPE
jgi:Caspase domain